MKTKINIIKSLFAGIFFVVMLISCEDKDNNVDLSYNRIFRPISFTVTSTADVVNIEWSAVPGASRYVYQLSQDSLQFENIVYTDSIDVIFPDTVSGYNVSINGLMPQTKYSVRLQVKAVDVTILPSKYSQFYFLSE